MYVPWLGIEPATLAYGDSALTKGGTWPGQEENFLKTCSHKYKHTVTLPGK